MSGGSLVTQTRVSYFVIVKTKLEPVTLCLPHTSFLVSVEDISQTFLQSWDFSLGPKTNLPLFFLFIFTDNIATKKKKIQPQLAFSNFFSHFSKIKGMSPIS